MFSSSPARSMQLYCGLKPLFWGMHHYDSLIGDRRAGRWLESLIRPMRPAFASSFGLSTLTQNPQAGGGGGNTTCDGWVQALVGGGQAFSTLRSTASGIANVTTTQGGVILAADATTNLWDEIQRCSDSYDTSSIGTLPTISSASLSYWGAAAANQFANSTAIYITSVSTGSPNNLVAGDFNINLWTGPSYGSIADTSFSATGYNVISLNSSGMAHINVSGVTVFGEMMGFDFLNSAPTWASGSPLAEFVWFSADNGTHEPILTVNYALPGHPYTNFLPQLLAQ